MDLHHGSLELSDTEPQAAARGLTASLIFPASV